MYATRLHETLPRVREEIRAAAQRADRDAAHVRLIAVTKGHPLEAIQAALAAGLQDLGENRVGELREKVDAVGRQGVRWHMIGHVQSRKAALLVGMADLIHSVDRASLVRKLSRASVAEGTVSRVLVQVNTSGEDSKGGYELPEATDRILEVAETPGLKVEGLMTMAPFVDEEGILRGTFRRLRELLDTVRSQNRAVGSELSMGMSNDLRFAVEEGSTMVRVGTALFGPREAQG